MSRRLAVLLLVGGLAGLILGLTAAGFESRLLAAASGVLALLIALIGLAVAARATTRPEPLRDPATGLVRRQALELILQQRVGAARRTLRPVALAHFEVGDGMHQSETVAARVADLARVRLRESDIVFRLGAHHFAVILEDTSETGAVWAMERLRRGLFDAGIETPIWAGISCYPAHSMDALGVQRSAARALQMAKEWPRARIEVAPLSD